jgi:tetratricopeptide (TPR) repeat protein
MWLVHLFSCLSFFFFVPFAFSQPQPSPSQEKAKRLGEKGQKLYEQGLILQALEAYKKASKLSPESPGPYREIARCYRDLKQHEQAIHYLSEYLSRKPTADLREGLVQYIDEQRPQLSKKNKVLITVNSEPQGAVVFVANQKGEVTGIGVTPLKAHPIDADAVLVRLVAPLFEVAEEKLDATKGPLEVSTTLAPEKRPTPVVTQAPSTKKTRAFVYFGAGAASVVGSLVLGSEFNQSVTALNNTSVNDPERDRLLRVVVAEAVSADVLGVIAVGAGVLGVLHLRKVKKEKRASTNTLRITPSGLALSGSF